MDRALFEPDFEVSCLVADFLPDSSSLPGRDSQFTSHANEVTVFRGVTWLEPLPDTAVAKCDFTDAVAMTTEGVGIVVRIALRPGWLELIEDPTEVSEFFALRGLA